MDQNLEQPFFTQLLEGQQFPEVKTDVKGGPGGVVTLKYPSDDDDDPWVVEWP